MKSHLRAAVPCFLSAAMLLVLASCARKDVYENLRATGIIDPAKVARVALENAASIAGMFLTTECVIVDAKEDKPEMPMGNPGMGGMM